jgi:release factor glutamine methyltransferase
MTTLLAARRAGLLQLQAAGVPDAGQDMAVLLAHALGVGRADLALLPSQTAMTAPQTARLNAALAARAARKPISHITGQRLFWGRSFAVTPDVLDPRPETETLIAAALSVPFVTVLDLGTGSGCVLLTLLAERPNAKGLGVDVSDAALVVARANHAQLGGAAQFAQGSWFGPVQGVFDLITSNPPYIAADEMAGLSPEVHQWEPHLALTPGGDGLTAYRAICAGAAAHLAPDGWLMVEIGPQQGAPVTALFADAGLHGIQILPDLDGRDRVVMGQLKSPTSTV